MTSAQSTKSVTFKSVSSLRLPSGMYLFFPQFHARSDGGEIDAVVIKDASARRKRLDGTIVGKSLFLVLDTTRFRQLANMLRRRPLEKEPVTFKYELNERQAVVELSIDGHVLCEPSHRPRGSATC